MVGVRGRADGRDDHRRTTQDGSFNLYAKVQAAAGSGLTSLIADSIAVPFEATYPTTTAVEPPVTAQDGAVPESLWQGPAQTDTVLVIDSLRRLRVDVPSPWRDVRQYPSYNDDGSDRPRIVASLHIETMLQQWEIPGDSFIEYPYVDPGDSSRTSSRARPPAPTDPPRRSTTAPIAG